MEGADLRVGLVSDTSASQPSCHPVSGFLFAQRSGGWQNTQESSTVEIQELLLALGFFHSVWMAPRLLLAARIQGS